MSKRDSKGKFTKARPLKVGDHVCGLRWTENIPATGKITGFCSDGDPFIEWPGGSALLKCSTVIHAKPAPQPKADDAKDAEIERLKAERDEAYAAMRSKDQKIIEAEAKLADIKAIMRTFKLLRGAKISSIEDAVGHVLEAAA